MPVEVIMPKVDMDMSHGTLATWHVAEGDSVQQGAPLFDIETDKAAMEVEAPASGRLHHLRAAPGDRIPVGQAIAWLYADGEAVGEAPAKATATAAGAESAAQAAPEPPVEPPRSSPRPPVAPPLAGLRATPAARATARAAGLPLTGLTGSGPRGRIQRADVAAPAPTQWSPQPGPLVVTRRPGSGTPLFLIHGFASDARSWTPLEREIGRDRALIRLDLPGHGTSPRRRITRFGDLSRMMVEAFDAATIDGAPVHLVAHSLGAAVAIALADIRSRKIARLSLIAPAGLGPEIDGQTLRGIIRASRVESLRPWLGNLTATPDRIGDDYATAAMATRQDPQLRACQQDMAEVLFPDGVQAFDLRPALERVEIPTRILWGRADRILPWRQILSLRTDAALHLLDGLGHIPQYEAPDRVARALDL